MAERGLRIVGPVLEAAKIHLERRLRLLQGGRAWRSMSRSIDRSGRRSLPPRVADHHYGQRPAPRRLVERQALTEPEGGESMPTLLLTNETVDALGVSRDELRQQELTADARRVLAALLTGHGFDVTRAIHVRELANAEGFLLTQ